MQYVCEKSLVNFEFWSGAKDTVAELTTDELQTIEAAIEDMSVGGEYWTDTQINDYFWFERDEIAQTLNYYDWETLETLRNYEKIKSWITEAVGERYPDWELTDMDLQVLADGMEYDHESYMDLDSLLEYELEHNEDIEVPTGEEEDEEE